MFHAKTAMYAAAGLLISANAASAIPAMAESDLNMRSGPGTEYPVVAVIPGGRTVDVGQCTGSWCAVAYRGRAGYASRSYLALGGGAPTYAAPSPYPAYGYGYYDDYAYGPEYYVYGTPGIVIGGRFGHHHRFGRRWQERRFTHGGFERRGFGPRPGAPGGNTRLGQGGGNFPSGQGGARAEAPRGGQLPSAGAGMSGSVGAHVGGPVGGGGAVGGAGGAAPQGVGNVRR